jgi:DNA invertase Pin-like site-specific DNA recombinase
MVRDLVPASGPLTDRPGLSHALDQIAGGRAGGLVLAQLSDLTRTAAELALVLQRLDRAGGFLVALDCELDTTTRAGRLATRALTEIAGWEPNRIARPIAARSPGANGAARHALAVRIAAMRAQGLSLQAICDALNAEGIPTPWPDTHWRPSTVDTAIHTTHANGGR